jgi:ribose transport system substrate-binding protein
MKKYSLHFAVCFAALLVCAGCKQEAAPGEKAGQAATAETPRQFTNVIAVITKLTNTVFWKSVHAGAQQAGKEYGYEIAWSGPNRETNSALQIQLVNDAIARQVAGVVIAPVHRMELVPAVDKLAELKIPCAIVDSGVETVNFLCFAATANYEGGVLAARRMGQTLGGTGNVLVLRHLAGSGATVKRVSGFVDTITNEFPGIKIVDSQSGEDTVGTARQATEQMLAKHPDVQGLFACNIDMSLGALQALQTQKRTGVKLIAFDPDKALLDGLRQGRVDSIVLQNPYKMGYEGVRAVALKIKGQTVPRMIDTGVEIVTDETLTEPKMLRLLGQLE